MSRVRVVESKLCEEFKDRENTSIYEPKMLTLYDFDNVSECTYYKDNRVLYLEKELDEENVWRTAIVDVPKGYKIFTENVPINIV